MKNTNFIQRSIIGALSFLRDSIFSQEQAMRPGFLQSLDPRIKLITFLVFIVQVLFARSLWELSFFYSLCLILAVFSKIKLGFFLLRTWIFIPLFSLFIAVPAILSFFSPGEVLFSRNILGLEFMVTRQGVDSALFFVLRVASSVSFAVLLSITTRHFELLRVLRVFKIPQIFVMTLGTSYRYVYLFVEMTRNTYLAIKSRVGILAHYKSGQNIVAWNIACLWSRSVHLNEEVYKAMLSRGYQGEALAWVDFKIRTRDFFWLLGVVLLGMTNLVIRS
ncbi:MAG: cobalt ECF transporter T component CbiQ [Candidatus Omnitrophica bacterium]|nr:cobalt ECF transporter T component CbiQ [Candidatus Omnitrophota bacterium]MDD5660287.1 cobalt ECF transporter T component CbiQ [Candidatus Omnitrophota bacterium]